LEPSMNNAIFSCEYMFIGRSFRYASPKCGVNF